MPVSICVPEAPSWRAFKSGVVKLTFNQPGKTNFMAMVSSGGSGYHSSSSSAGSSSFSFKPLKPLVAAKDIFHAMSGPRQEEMNRAANEKYGMLFLLLDPAKQEALMESHPPQEPAKTTVWEGFQDDMLQQLLPPLEIPQPKINYSAPAPVLQPLSQRDAWLYQGILKSRKAQKAPSLPGPQSGPAEAETEKTAEALAQQAADTDAALPQSKDGPAPDDPARAKTGATGCSPQEKEAEG